MRNRYGTLVLAVVADFLGGALSSRLFTVPAAEAAGIKTFDSIATTHLIVSGDIVIESKANRPLVIRDGNGNSLEFLYTAPPSPAFSMAINNAMTARTNVPAVVVSENGVAIVRNTGDGTVFGAQISPDRLVMSHIDQSKAPQATSSTTVSPTSVDVSFDDLKPADSVHSMLSGNGFSYTGNGKTAKLPQ